MTIEDSFREHVIKFSKKYACPISLLNNASQVFQRELKYHTFRLDRKLPFFTVAVALVVDGEERVEAEGYNKKFAKREAAKQFVSILLEESVKAGKPPVASESAKNPSKSFKMSKITKKAPEPVTFSEPPSNDATVSVWISNLELLSTDLAKSCKSLQIFALNTGTGEPKYKLSETGEEELYTVLCVWNKYVQEGFGLSRADAELMAARKMLNKVREFCGMPSLSVPEITLPEKKESSDEPGGAGGLDWKTVQACGKFKHLLEVNEGESTVRRQEGYPGKLGVQEPEYSILGVHAGTEHLVVKVNCASEASGPSEVETVDKTMLGVIREQVEPECPELESPEHSLVSQTVINVPTLKLLKKNIEGLEEEDLSVTYSQVITKAPGGLEEDQDKESDDTKYCLFPSVGVGSASVTVTRRDYMCLQDEQFLNDTIIDFYLRYLQAGLFRSNPAIRIKTHIFSIYFYNRLTMKPKAAKKMASKKIWHGMEPLMSPAEQAHNNVKNWTKNIDIFSKDFVVVPIHDYDHWYVAIICYPGLTKPVRGAGGKVRQPLILLLDSLEDGQKDTVCQVLRDYLTCEWRDKKEVEGGKQARHFLPVNMPGYCPAVPQQQNLTDCGLYVLEYVESFFRNPIKDFSIPIASLNNWFTADQVQRKRERIARLIRDLALEQNKGTKMEFPDIGFEIGESTFSESSVGEKTRINIESLTSDPSVTKKTMYSDIEPASESSVQKKASKNLMSHPSPEASVQPKMWIKLMTLPSDPLKPASVNNGLRQPVSVYGDDYSAEDNSDQPEIKRAKVV